MFKTIKLRKKIVRIVSLILLTLGAIAVMMPLAWMLLSSFKSPAQGNKMPPEWLPKKAEEAIINDQEYYLYEMPVDGTIKKLALIEKNGPIGTFVNPENPAETYELRITDGERAMQIYVSWDNYVKALTMVPFGKYLVNTMIIVVFATLGTVISSVMVAYGFSRFKVKSFKWLFLILLGTIMLPTQVTLIPTFILFRYIGWYDTLLPLIVPAFFANAWDVFLFRQFFMSIPLELDDAARIDGANPLQILWYVILPQSKPVIITVTIFSILYAWNDFFNPLIYLQSEKNWTISLGLQMFNAIYRNNDAYLLAASVVTLIPIVILYFIAQRYFIQGVVVSGVKG
ncbi:MAG: carbohydrate ABC transporter permease [Anaerolineaceae bacterium]|jgi:multiple sugar transport system permease protein